jgi:hypothetical protein
MSHLHETNQAEDERGASRRYILAKKLKLVFGCRKGSLGYGCPRTRSSGVDGKTP